MNSGGAFRKAKYEIRRWRKSEGGQSTAINQFCSKNVRAELYNSS